MFCALRSKLSKIISLITPKKTEIQSPEVVIQFDGNPWKDNLSRLAEEGLEKRGAAPPQQEDDITDFVNNLAHKAGVVEVPLSKREGDNTFQSIQASGVPKRALDGTVQDIQSWYGQSLASGDYEKGKAISAQWQKRKGKSDSRWFQ